MFLPKQHNSPRRPESTHRNTHKDGTDTSLLFFLSFFFLLIYLILAMLGIFAMRAFSLVAASQGHSLVALCRLLLAIASLTAKHRLYGAWTQ